MTKKTKKKSQESAVPKRTSHDELAREVELWESGSLTPAGWRDAPEAVPRNRESKLVSIRFPVVMIELLKLFAQQEGIGYQVLIKRWLDDRLRNERDKLRYAARQECRSSLKDGGFGVRPVPLFPIQDSEKENGPHYIQKVG